MSKEFVKERVLKYLMEDLLVPQDMIDTNVPLSEFEEGAEGVLDIIVNVVVKEHGEDYYVPVLIVTCVDEDFVMEGEALQKEIDYLEELDKQNDYAFYNYAEDLEYSGRYFVKKGVLTKKQWIQLCNRYGGF